MDFKDFWAEMTTAQRQEFAEACGTTVAQLRNVAYGKRCGEKLAINIDRESGGEVPCEMLRPDVDFPYLRSVGPRATA